jgi:hypothetical protein
MVLLLSVQEYLDMILRSERTLKTGEKDSDKNIHGIRLLLSFAHILYPSPFLLDFLPLLHKNLTKKYHPNVMYSVKTEF